MFHVAAVNGSAFVRTVSRGVKGGGNISSMNMNMGNVVLDIHEPRFGVHGD